MRRLIWLPALFAAGCVYGYWTGYAGPILITAARCLRARADAPDYEPEVL